jgi:hypothetical protein
VDREVAQMKLRKGNERKSDKPKRKPTRAENKREREAKRRSRSNQRQTCKPNKINECLDTASWIFPMDFRAGC